MFFKIFPKTYYAFDLKNDSVKTVTNIFSRFKMRNQVLQNAFLYDKYQVLDGETLEVVSYKLYGTPKYHWVLCMCNDIIDPQFDLPLDQISLEKNIIKNYGFANVEQAMSTRHHYELVVNKLIVQADGFSSESTEKSETSLEQYDYTSNTVVTMTLNSPSVSTVQLRANNADLSSAITHTITITTTYKEVSVFDYEVEQNEKKRAINVLKPQYISIINRELERVLND